MLNQISQLVLVHPSVVNNFKRRFWRSWITQMPVHTLLSSMINHLVNSCFNDPSEWQLWSYNCWWREFHFKLCQFQTLSHRLQISASIAKTVLRYLCIIVYIHSWTTAEAVHTYSCITIQIVHYVHMQKVTVGTVTDWWIEHYSDTIQTDTYIKQ